MSIPLPTKNNMSGAENYNLYDSIDDEVLQAYNEFTLATMVYYGLKEAQCSEQSSRMTAMDSASKNAGTRSQSTLMGRDSWMRSLLILISI